MYLYVYKYNCLWYTLRISVEDGNGIGMVTLEGDVVMATERVTEGAGVGEVEEGEGVEEDGERVGEGEEGAGEEEYGERVVGVARKASSKAV